MTSTPIPRIAIIGSAATHTSRTGRLKRYDARKMFRPTSGVRNPSSRFAMKMMPRCTGWIPNAAPSGTMSGTTTTIAAQISMSHPTASRNRFSTSRNVNFDVMFVRAHASSLAGTCAPTR